MYLLCYMLYIFCNCRFNKFKKNLVVVLNTRGAVATKVTLKSEVSSL